MSLLNELILEFINNGSGNDEHFLKIPTLYDNKKFFCLLTKITQKFKLELDDKNLENCIIYHMRIIPENPVVDTTHLNVFENISFLDENNDSVSKIIDIITKNKIICKYCHLGFVYKNFPACWSCTERLANNRISENDICSICRENNDFFSIDLSCEHRFHSSCLYKLVNKNATKCPNCRNIVYLNLGSTKMLQENCPILNYGYYLD